MDSQRDNAFGSVAGRTIKSHFQIILAVAFVTFALVASGLRAVRPARRYRKNPQKLHSKLRLRQLKDPRQSQPLLQKNRGL